MAGGRKNQRKKKKKGWRAMLNGCFNKTNFAVTNSPEKRPEASVEGEGGAGGMAGASEPFQRPHRFSAPVYHADYGTPANEPPPIRGILKKSPTSSSCHSGLYAESSGPGSVYYNPIYSDPLYSKGGLYASQSHQHQHQHQPQDENGFGRHSFTYGVGGGDGKVPVWNYSSTGGSGGGAGGAGGAGGGGTMNAPRRWPEGLSPPASGRHRYDGALARTRPDAREASPHAGYTPKSLLRHQLEQHASSPPGSGGAYESAFAASPPLEQRQEGRVRVRAGGTDNRWSYPHSSTTSVQSTGSRINNLTSPLPSRRDRNALALVPYSARSNSNNNNNDNAHQGQLQLWDPRSPQQQQQAAKSPQYQAEPDPYRGDPHRFRPITSPPSSWYGGSSSTAASAIAAAAAAAAMNAESQRRRASSQPRQQQRDYADLDISSIEAACERGYRSANATPAPRQQHGTPSHYHHHYYSGGTPSPRCRDPIRKPMGSQFCPYSNPIYGVVVQHSNYAPSSAAVPVGGSALAPPSRPRHHAAPPSSSRGAEPIYANHVQMAHHNNNNNIIINNNNGNSYRVPAGSSGVGGAVVGGDVGAGGGGGAYNVAQIYATVCRSSDANATSSCVYASFAWKQSACVEPNNGPAAAGGGGGALVGQFPPLMDALPIPPALPPPLLRSSLPWPSVSASSASSSQPDVGAMAPTAVGGVEQGNAPPSYPHHNPRPTGDQPRPPLPTYEEIISLRSKVKSTRARPASWCEFTDGKETERKREAFMNLLAQRYPQYADRIQGPSSGRSTPVPPLQQQQSQQQAPIEKPARSREPQRRRTAVVTYDPAQATNTLEYDDLGTMSDLELPSFQRGNFMRTSLPIVRSASTSLERPLGLVFLVYGEQTKKSLLPNEITTLDTVRALFVRAFGGLSMEMMEETRKKIYILDKSNNIYFQLEDLAEITDRSVLKLHDTDNDEPQKVRERQEVRGRTVQMPVSRSQSRQDNPDFVKAHSLPPGASQDYQELAPDQRGHPQYDLERRSRSRTPEPTDRPRSLSAGASTSRPRFSHSPDRLPTPERGPLNPIPENRQLNPGYRDPQGVNYYETIGPASPAGHRGHHPASNYEVVPPGQHPAYPGPAHAHPPPQPIYATRGARPMMHPQRAPGPIYDTRDGARGSNPARHSLAFAPNQMTPVDGPYQRSQSYRIPPTEREHDYARSLSATPTEDRTKNRIEKMEAQLANLTAWVHYQKADTQPRREPMRGPRSIGSTTSDSSDTFPASSTSKNTGEITSLSTLATTNNVETTKGLSDIPDGQKMPTPSSDLAGKAVPTEISGKLSKLKSELHTLKRQQQLNMEAMRDEFLSAFSKIKNVCSSVPGSENQVNFHQRTGMTQHKQSYLRDKGQVTQELFDLESTVEELRGDVISRKCRVNVNDVEGMALLLSNITKNLADLKVRFPELQGEMKTVMDSEMRVVVSEEKFLKEEPAEIEGCLKRCKKLTETLYTLKRLASVQDHRPPHIPNVNSADEGMGDSDQKKALLENIRAMVPDHDQRVQHMEAADASRERKKKISVQQEALKFGKSLEIASKALRPPSTSDEKMAATAAEQELEEKEMLKSNAVPNEGIYVASRSKSPVTIKPVSSAPTHPPVYSHPLASVVSTGIATSVTSTTSLVTSKASFSSSLTSSTLKAMERPEVRETAIVSSDSGHSQAQSKPPPPHSQPSSSRSATLPLTQTTERLSSQVQTGTGPVAKTITTSEAGKRPASSSSVSVARPPVYSKPSTMGALMRKERSAPLADEEDLVDFRGRERPKSSPVPHAQTIHPHVVSAKSFDEDYDKKPEANGHINGHPNNNNDKQAAPSSAIYNSPSRSSSTSSPSRNSMDAGGSVAKVTPGGTITLMLSGTVSPKSPTDPGTYTITPPVEIISPSPSSSDTPSSSTPPVRRDSTRSDDSSCSSTSQGESNAKQKKVPPPPPPRKGSRPTSVSGLPTVNGGSNHSSPSQPQDTPPPQFVGGILGQHRLSGGPLSSTPKAQPPQRPMSTFEKDIASGIYANLNRPDLQSQNSSPQQMINQVASSSSSAGGPRSSNNNNGQEKLPAAPSVTSNSIDREERGSSSESTGSSSGASMGSQQSVVNIVRTGSLNVKATKPKPEPPRRQSSLFSKTTNSSGRDTLVHDRKKTLNGVDL